MPYIFMQLLFTVYTVDNDKERLEHWGDENTLSPRNFLLGGGRSPPALPRPFPPQDRRHWLQAAYDDRCRNIYGSA